VSDAPDYDEILAAIRKVRRDMPRNAGVLQICDGFETLQKRLKEMETKAVAARAISSDAKRSRKPREKTFDKTAYQREYMRKRRADLKKKKAKAKRKAKTK
jgi:hypothetical protein